MSFFESLLSKYHQPQNIESTPYNPFYSLPMLTTIEVTGLLQQAGSGYQNGTKEKTQDVIQSIMYQDKIHPHLAFYQYNSTLYVGIVENNKLLNLCDKNDKRIAKSFIKESLHHSPFMNGDSILNLAEKYYPQKDTIFVDTGCESGVEAFSIIISSEDPDKPYLLTFYMNYNPTIGCGRVIIPEIQAERLQVNNEINNH